MGQDQSIRPHLAGRTRTPNMASLSSALRCSRCSSGIVSLAALIMWAASAGGLSAAEPVSPTEKLPEKTVERSVLLKEQDWRRSPRKPVTPREVDGLIAKEMRASKNRIE